MFLVNGTFYLDRRVNRVLRHKLFTKSFLVLYIPLEGTIKFIPVEGIDF